MGRLFSPYSAPFHRNAGAVLRRLWHQRRGTAEIAFYYTQRKPTSQNALRPEAFK